MRAFFSSIVFLVAIGCSPKSNTTDVSGAMDETSAIAIARKAVSTNDTWVGRATFKAMRDGTGWSVHVERWPPDFGGHRTVKIDTNGNVTAYSRGK
jgi:hypothetical protein